MKYPILSFTILGALWPTAVTSQLQQSLRRRHLEPTESNHLQKKPCTLFKKSLDPQIGSQQEEGASWDCLGLDPSDGDVVVSPVVGRGTAPPPGAELEDSSAAHAADNQLTKPCTLYKKIVHTSWGSQEEESWDCLLDPADGDIFVTAPSELDLSDAVSGTTTLFAPGLAVIQEEAVIQNASQVVLGGANVRQRDRHLAVDGSLDFVVVRVTCKATGKAMAKSLEGAMQDVFDDASCLKSQLDGCSNGTVVINKGPNGGGIDISIDECLTESTATNAVTTALTTFLGKHPRTFPKTYFMYCMPPDIGFPGIAYAYVNSWLSVFNNEWCGFVSVQLHEVGHNFNLGHGGDIDSVEYGDTTGAMGFSYEVDDTTFCYNAPNMFQLGWLKQVVDLSSQPGPESWQLVGHTNYGGGLQAIRLLGTPSSKDTYIWFNQAIGINAQTGEGSNQVIVTTRPSGIGYSKSYMEAKLRAGGVYNPGNTYYSLRVISIENGSAQITLQLITPAPVAPEPTQAPATPAPVAEPTLAPATPAPVPEPTVAPATPAPVPEPTLAPATPAPVPEPTLAPATPAPVPEPTLAPATPAPIPEPTLAPATPAPVPEPTPAPLTARTALPVPEPTPVSVITPIAPPVLLLVTLPTAAPEPTPAPVVCPAKVKNKSQCPVGCFFKKKSCFPVVFGPGGCPTFANNKDECPAGCIFTKKSCVLLTSVVCPSKAKNKKECPAGCYFSNKSCFPIG